MSSNQALTVSYALALVGGLVVLLVGIVNFFWFGAGSPDWGGYGSYMRGVMDGNHGFMGSYAGSYSFLAGISLVSLICGVIVVVGAVMLRFFPRDHRIWGVVIIVFSAVSFVGMGGYFFGAILGLGGGALALSYKPRT